MVFHDETGNTPERSESIKQVIHQVVDIVISDHRPHYELNKVASCLTRFRRDSGEDLWICLGRVLHVLPEPLIQMLNPFDFQLLSLARSVGMSASDIFSAKRLVNENNFDPIPGNADILRHVRWNEFLHWLRPYIDLPSSPIDGLLSFVAVWRSKSAGCESSSIADILIEAREVLLPLSLEQISAHAELFRDFNEVFYDVAGMLIKEILSFPRDLAILENRLGSAFQMLKRLSIDHPSPPQIQQLLDKVTDVNNGEARILILDRLRGLIFRGQFVLPDSPQSMHLLEAIVDVCVGIFKSRPPSLAPLAEFIESIHQPLQLMESEYGSYLFGAAFKLAKRFGIRFLLDYPSVIPPDWSEKKVLSIRKIIGCMIHFNNVSEFPWSYLARADEASLAQAASVLSVMNKRLLLNWEDARLFTPYSFLREFFRSGDGPSRFGEMISQTLLLPPLPSGLDSKLENLPRIVTGFLQNQPRFDDVYVPLAKRANLIIANLRGLIPLNVIDELRVLPELLLGSEINHWHEPLIRSDLKNFVNDLVLPYFDLIEALGRLPPGHPGNKCLEKTNGPVLSYLAGLI